jgi:hypothetical protein
MAIDKGLYAAPVGLEQAAQNEHEIEIEIEDPESVSIGMDGQPILEIEQEEESPEFSKNLAEDMDEGTLSEIADELKGFFESDVAARRDWVDTYSEGLKLLGLRIEEKTEPWEGACGVFHPMLTESVVRFQSESIMETFPAQGPVKTQIIGKETQSRKQSAERVQDDMNYKLTEQMTEYRPEHEKLLWNLPLAGSAFKKVYYDPSLGRQVAMFIPAEDVVVPYGAANLETADRVTHVMRKTKNEVKKLMAAGFYRDVELPEPTGELDDIEKKKAESLGFTATQDNRYRILEMHVNFDLPGYEDDNEIGVPYVITFEKSTGTILAIRRNWYEEDVLKLKRNHFVHYQYIPGFGFYGYGLIHLIGGYARSATSIIRQLVDAGTLSNLPGGLKSRGLRVKGDDTPIAPGEFRDVDVPSGSIRDNILPLPYKEPSQVLYTLFQNIVAEGRAFATAGDTKISDMSANAPVGTTLAILERTLKVMSAVQARVHYAMKTEFKLLKVIIADYTPEDYDYEPEEGSRAAKKADYDDVEVIPVSDPNAATMAQKIVQYQAVLQLAQQAPQLYNLPLLHRQMVEVLGVKNAAKLIPMEDDMVPTDPVSENQNILKMKPVKAFIEQDHQAHIAVHMAATQDPKIMGLVGQSPLAQQIGAAMQAHISEHLGFEYRKQIEATMGMPLPPMPEPGEDAKPMNPMLAAQVAQMSAQAAQQLLQRNTQEEQAKQAQQQAQDPLIQLQQQELQIKQQEVQLKQQKQQIEAAAKADQLAIERERIAAQKEIAGMQVGAKVAKDKEELKSRNQLEGMRIGTDIAKHKAQLTAQHRQQSAQQQQMANKPTKKDNE